MLQALVAVVLTLAFAQPNDQWYVGNWTAEFEGITFVRLELAVANGKPGGRIALGNMELNADGALRKATPAQAKFTEIFDVVVRASDLSFSVKDSDEVDRFQLGRLDGELELRFVLTDEMRKEMAESGIRELKPVRLKKAL